MPHRSGKERSDRASLAGARRQARRSPAIYSSGLLFNFSVHLYKVQESQRFQVLSQVNEKVVEQKAEECKEPRVKSCSVQTVECGDKCCRCRRERQERAEER